MMCLNGVSAEYPTGLSSYLKDPQKLDLAKVQAVRRLFCSIAACSLCPPALALIFVLLFAPVLLLAPVTLRALLTLRLRSHPHNLQAEREG